MQHRYRVKELLALLTKELQSGSIPRAAREAQLFVMAFLEVDELWLLSHQEQFIERDITPLLQQIQRRKAQEPFEYIVQKVSFYSHQFYIDKGALIPRPETELLIDEVCKNVTDEATRSCFVEVGVGSGIISIILAQHLKNSHFIAIDISQDALNIAKKNREKFGLESRIELRLGSLLDQVDEPIDYLVSNPPYIENGVELESNLSYEQQNALFGGEVGDEIIKKLLDEVLRRDINFFTCEMGYDQKGKIQHYLKDKRYKTLEFYKDYASFDRGFTLKVHT